MASRDSGGTSIEHDLPLRRVLIVAHTHWDREWYSSFGSFRYRLLRATQRVLDLLDEGQLAYFLFDGQTVVLEDVCEVLSPEDRRRLAHYVKRGVIEIGPWYVLPDEFLVSGESLIRNLHTGISDAVAWGARPSCAYLPDLFGHVSQMPQLARAVGLSDALIFRGADVPAVSVNWHGADETVVPAHVLPRFAGYFNPFLNDPDFKESFDQFLSEMEPYLRGGEPIILLAGADHTVPASDWATRLACLEDRSAGSEPGRAGPGLSTTKETRVTQSSVSKALSEVNAYIANNGLVRHAIHGEQRDNSKAFVLGGILSSRQYLKRLNRETEELITGIVEPLTVFADESDLQPHFIRTLWRQLLRNQPHDSIGGCSIDEVHRANVARYEEILSAGRRYIHDILRHLTSADPGEFQPYVTLFNLLPYSDDERVVTVDIDVPEAYDLGHVQLVVDGKPIASDLLKRIHHDGFTSEMERAPTWTPTVRYTVLTELAFDGVGSRDLWVEPVEPRATPAPGPDPRVTGIAEAGPATIANEHLHLSVLPSGSVTVTDRLSGHSIVDAIVPFHQPDDGDSYTCVPGTAARWRFASATEALHGNFFGSISLYFDGPSGSRLTLHLTLRAGEPVCRIRVAIHNAAENVRYQLRFSLPNRATKHFSDTAFDVVARIPGRPRWHYTRPRTEAPESGFPTSSFMWAERLVVVHDGLHEYECDERAVYTTLLRATGMLSKAALATRGGGAGPALRTPEGQCKGDLSAELAFGFCELNEAAPLSRRFLQPVIAMQGTRSAAGSPLLSIDNPHAVMSALYRYEPDTWFCRLWNPTDSQQLVTLSTLEPGSWHRVSMATERKLAWDATGMVDTGAGLDERVESLALKPNEIATLVWFKERS